MVIVVVVIVVQVVSLIDQGTAQYFANLHGTTRVCGNQVKGLVGECFVVGDFSPQRFDGRLTVSQQRILTGRVDINR